MVLKVLNQLGKHVGSLISAKELSVFAGLMLKLARLEYFLSSGGVLALFNGIIEVQVDLVTNSVPTADTTLGRLLCALAFVVFSLSVSCLNDALVSDGKLLLDLLRCGVWTLHPGVTDDVCH